MQRAPPQAGQRGNSSGQGQDQGQGQGQSPGQGQGRNPHRAHFRHARAQSRLPRIDGNAMYLGAMSFPAGADGQGRKLQYSVSREEDEHLLSHSYSNLNNLYAVYNVQKLAGIVSTPRVYNVLNNFFLGQH